MKKYLKAFLGSLLLSVLLLNTTCYADVIDGAAVREKAVNAALIMVVGILVLLVVAVSIIMIIKLIRNKKDEKHVK